MVVGALLGGVAVPYEADGLVYGGVGEGRGGVGEDVGGVVVVPVVY